MYPAAAGGRPRWPRGADGRARGPAGLCGRPAALLHAGPRPVRGRRIPQGPLHFLPLGTDMTDFLPFPPLLSRGSSPCPRSR